MFVSNYVIVHQCFDTVCWMSGRAYCLHMVHLMPLHPKTGVLKTQVLENASTEKTSTKQRISQAWKTHVQKMQVQCKPSVR